MLCLDLQENLEQQVLSILPIQEVSFQKAEIEYHQEWNHKGLDDE